MDQHILFADLVCYPATTAGAVALGACLVLAGLVVVTLVWGAFRDND